MHSSLVAIFCGHAHSSCKQIISVFGGLRLGCNEPEPCQRVLLDDVSILRSALQFSLKSGILRRCKLSITFHHHTFNYLFKDKGSPVKSKPGRYFDRRDFFTDYFEESFFDYYNKLGEGCYIVFRKYICTVMLPSIRITSKDKL